MTTPRDDSSAAPDPGGGARQPTSAGTDTDAGAGAPTDLELAWMFALNADLGADPQGAADGEARQRAERARVRRYDRYARDLIHDLRADPDRLAALADACGIEHARRAAAGYATIGGYATGAHLAELALAIVARADTDGAGRQQLLADLEAERTWTPDLRPPGIWDRHRLPR